MRYLIIASKFNSMISKALVGGAKDVFAEGASEGASIEEVWVPGAFELPIAAAKAARSKRYQAIICLGCVIRGETPHFEYVSGPVASGLMQISIETEVPIIFGVLTTDNAEQALQRSGLKGGNKGADAMSAAIEMVNVMHKLEGKNNL
ncbi:MAG: 6,7-dimethyl-8-ribityllumazine synthase [Bdellovibrionota bacterium]